MTFLNPSFLLFGIALAILVVLALWSHAGRRRRLAQFLGGKRAARRLSGSNLYRLHVERIVLLGLTALVLAGAAAEPRWPDEDTPPPPPPARSVILAIDVSASMQASDVSPTRLGQAVEVAGEMIETFGSDRVGLLLFAGSTYSLAPPTHDHAALRYFLGSLPTVASAYDPGTLLSVAIRETVAFAETGDEVDGEQTIILIGDGETDETEAAVLAQVRAAASQGIGIHVIGVGTDEGGVMVMPQATYQFGGEVVDESGVAVVSRLNESLLERIAEVGRGRYAHAADEAALRDFRGFFESQESDPLFARYELTFLFILTALAGLLIESLLDIRLPRKVVVADRRTT